MKVLVKYGLAGIVALGLLGPGTLALAQWQWDRDAGARMRGEYGRSPKARVAARSSTSATSATAASQSNAANNTASSSLAYQSYSYQPSAVAGVKRGDTITVASQSAALMIGQQPVGNVRQGERLAVSEVRGPWLGTWITAPGGRSVGGWIRSFDAALAK